jgi:nucleotide-binding universal stress UspA family protein
MSADIIVSYDGTPNDDDAIALASLLAQAGATIALAYVRHAPEFDLRREELAEHDARRRLEQGAALLGDPGAAQHVVISPSTPEGLAKLAATERASVIVFGSDYRTPPGHAEPGTSAQNLLEGGPIAIAVAPAGLRTQTDAAIRTIGVVAAESDAGARRTAEALAARLGATVAGSSNGPVDLTVVGSQDGTTDGRIALSGATRSALDSARGSVLVLPTGTSALT